MARIRTIKPEFWTDEKVVGLSSLARLAFIGLWNFVDDEGRAAHSPMRLKMQILPAEPADFSELLGELRGASLISIYTVDGKEYLQVNGFSRHQKIDHRSKSKIPPPPNPPESSEKKALDQGREGIREGNGSAADAASEEIQFFDRGKKLLGSNSGGLLKNLLKAKGGNVALARAALETASTKQDKREYIGAIVRGRDSPDDPRARGDAW